jgi:hypothetical protein
MDSNTYSIGPSTSQSTGESAGPPAGLATLAAELEGLAAQDLDGLTDATLAERVLQLRRQLDRLEGHWLDTEVRRRRSSVPASIRAAVPPECIGSEARPRAGRVGEWPALKGGHRASRVHGAQESRHRDGPVHGSHAPHPAGEDRPRTRRRP